MSRGGIGDRKLLARVDWNGTRLVLAKVTAPRLQASSIDKLSTTTHLRLLIEETKHLASLIQDHLPSTHNAPSTKISNTQQSDTPAWNTAGETTSRRPYHAIGTVRDVPWQHDAGTKKL